MIVAILYFFLCYFDISIKISLSPLSSYIQMSKKNRFKFRSNEKNIVSFDWNSIFLGKKNIVYFCINMEIHLCRHFK